MTPEPQLPNIDDEEAERGALGRHIRKAAAEVDAWPEWLKPAWIKGERLVGTQEESPLAALDASRPGDEIHIRAVNGDGQSCGCGQRSALRVHVGALSDGVTPEDVFLCRSCTFAATEDFIARTGQARYRESLPKERRRA